jgi:hypothetical protein
MLVAPFLSAMAVGATSGCCGGRAVVHAAAIAGGTVGTAFHLQNVLKREGEVSWLNVLYGAPIAAPLGLTFAGVFGLAADHVRRGDSSKTFSRLLAASAATGLAGTSAEAALLHFRGAFHNKLMYAPVLIAPITALFVARDLLAGRGTKTTRRLLKTTVALGFGGALLHTLAIGREMGGWRNWTQNLQVGPPIPAPPAFTAMALAALAALEVMDGR